MEYKAMQSQGSRSTQDLLSNNIFQGMPSLIKGQNVAEFSNSWPFSLELPLIQQIVSLDPNNDQYLPAKSNIKRIGKNTRITACKHVHLKPFAKSMCYKCYQKKGRSKKAYNCQHTIRANYAKGLCQPCYLVRYFQISKL